MRFKSNAQRKAVMAKLNFSQLQNKGVFLKYHGDADRDGVPNIKDCRPLNPHEQGFIHKWLVKREKKLDKELVMKNRILEYQQDKLLKSADKESIRLSKYSNIERKLRKNKELKESIKKMKQAEFRMSRTGKVLASTGRGAVVVGRVTGKVLASTGRGAAVVGRETGKGIILAGHGLSRLAKTRTARKIFKKIFSIK